MRNLKIIFAKQSNLLWGVLALLFSCNSGEKDNTIVTNIKNTINYELKEQYVALEDPQFIRKLAGFDMGKLNVVSGEDVIPFQIIDETADGKPDKIILLFNLGPNEEKEIQFTEGEKEKLDIKRTQAELSVCEGGEWVEVVKASGVKQFEYQGGKFKNISELRVPDQHTDHSFYIRYEGPGWESDKVGYRFYLDWRNAVDIFGKRTTDMVLQDVGQDGFESYHSFSDWGMDVLKVGNSLGIGSIGFWDGKNAIRIAVTDSIYCKISENGNLFSSIETKYYGWKDAGAPVDLTSTLSIFAGSRITWEKIELSNILDNLCTGIVKHENGDLIKSENNTGNWSYIATFGKQSLNDDNLGMFVFYMGSDLLEVTEDQYSHIVVLTPSDKTLKYGFGAVWEKDLDNISTKEQFIQYLNNTLELLNKPLVINY